MVDAQVDVIEELLERKLLIRRYELVMRKRSPVNAEAYHMH